METQFLQPDLIHNLRLWNWHKKNVVVTLDGQGADEMLAGYHYFFGYFFKDLLRQGKLGKLLKALFNYCRIHKSVYGIKTFIYFLLPENLKTKIRIKERGYLLKSFTNKYKGNNQIAGNLYGSESLKDALI